MSATGKATVRIDDAAIKARVRGLLADAWDEGYMEGTYDQTYNHTRLPNPYREDPA